MVILRKQRRNQSILEGYLLLAMASSLQSYIGFHFRNYGDTNRFKKNYLRGVRVTRAGSDVSNLLECLCAPCIGIDVEVLREKTDDDWRGISMTENICRPCAKPDSAIRKSGTTPFTGCCNRSPSFPHHPLFLGLSPSFSPQCSRVSGQPRYTPNTLPFPSIF